MGRATGSDMSKIKLTGSTRLPPTIKLAAIGPLNC